MRISSKIKGIVLVSGLLLIGGVFHHQYKAQIWEKSLNLAQGIDTCFVRVGQSFTQAMAARAESDKLSTAFTGLTGECFIEVGKQVKTLGVDNKNVVLAKVNRLQSDVHWFHERLQKMSRITIERDRELSSGYIERKFYELEELKNQIQEVVTKQTDATKREMKLSFMASSVSGAILILLFMANFVVGFRQSRTIRDIQRKAQDTLKNENQISASMVERILDKLTKETNTTAVYNLFNRYHDQLLDRISTGARQGPGPFSTDTLPPQQRLATERVAMVDLGFNSTLKSLGQKAFTHGILLDTDLDEGMEVVCEQEVFDQVIFNLINYAIDTSMEHNNGRKVVVRSKVLADRVYLKLTIANHYFNVSELELFGDFNKEGKWPVSLDVVRALISDVDASFVARNKVDNSGNLTGCEFEVVFKNASVGRAIGEDDVAYEGTELSDKNSRLVSVVKGSKKDLLKKMGIEF